MLTSKPFLIALGVVIAIVAIYNISFFSRRKPTAASDTVLSGSAGTPYSTARDGLLIQPNQPKAGMLPGHKLDAIAPSEAPGGAAFPWPLDWGTNVGRNPFLTPEEITGTTVKPVIKAPPTTQAAPYVVTLVSVAGDSRWAIIGSRVIHEGDLLDDKKVIAITAEGVTLKKGEQQYLLRLRQSPVHLEVHGTN